jgi:hypothetical protein
MAQKLKGKITSMSPTAIAGSLTPTVAIAEKKHATTNERIVLKRRFITNQFNSELILRKARMTNFKSNNICLVYPKLLPARC